MERPQIVLDTNVLVAGLRSRRGASFRILSLVGTGVFEINVSVPLVIEYEDVLLRHLPDLTLSERELDSVLDYLCQEARRHQVFFLWRPFLRDPKDDMLLELALVAGCDYIVTFNTRDFTGVEQFGVEVITPGDFLRQIGEVK